MSGGVTTTKIKRLRVMKKSNELKHYMFYWIDENGFNCGWNSVWAKGKVEAKKIIKGMEVEAHDGKYGRNAGMYLDKKSLRVVSEKRIEEQMKATYMD